MRIRISPEETRLLQELILEHCGVNLGVDAGFLFERRLGVRLEALSLASFREYFHYLSYDLDGPAELEDCIERITTHETYFFREQFQLDAFRQEIIPQLVHGDAGGRGPAVWSAGCSTGEEAYTIAMLLAEAAPQAASLVIGSDISRKVLATAQQGVYGPASFRTTDDAVRDRQFLPAGPGLWRVPPSIRRMCSFVHLNLLEVARYATLGRLDVIFCRNVLIYLSAPARHRIVEAFYDALVPGGFLLLGHSESLLNVTTRFDLVHLTSDLVYRRPA
ncbi:protein-glutamate O-methyltransferase CheR [Nannocystis sp.]|uniref:CheR family methyltransferase n=1 Tax=Nannocystis sp. TaxID=1962667 RepID=UPI0025CC57A1|nr:protein-glutamate O-methyltransferase CheR [Nannocystis sp.]